MTAFEELAKTELISWKIRYISIPVCFLCKMLKEILTTYSLLLISVSSQFEWLHLHYMENKLNYNMFSEVFWVQGCKHIKLIWEDDARRPTWNVYHALQKRQLNECNYSNYKYGINGPTINFQKSNIKLAKL